MKSIKLLFLIVMLTFYFHSMGQVSDTTKNLSSESAQLEEYRRKSDDITAIINILNIQSQTIENINQMIELLNNKYEISRTKIDTILKSLSIKYVTSSSLQKNNLTKEELLNADTFFSIVKALQSPMSVFKLDLSKNALTSVPEEIKQFKNLQKLVLSDNLIEEIPDWIGELKALQYFYISNNRLEEIPKQLTELDSMILIDISCNPIRYGTLGIRTGENLKYLILHDTKINYKELNRLEKSLSEIIVK